MQIAVSQFSSIEMLLVAILLLISSLNPLWSEGIFLYGFYFLKFVKMYFMAQKYIFIWTFQSLGPVYLFIY